MWSQKVSVTQLLVTRNLLTAKNIKQESIAMSDLLPWSSMSSLVNFRDGPKKDTRCTKLSWVSIQKIFLEVNKILFSYYQLTMF